MNSESEKIPSVCMLMRN